jgi:hypothetical protein
MSMNQKFIVKMEKGTLEQTYKIPEMDLTEGVNSVFEVLDEAFLKLVAERFIQMQRDYLDAYYRYNY